MVRKKKPFKNKRRTKIIPVKIPGTRPRAVWVDEMSTKAPRHLSRDQRFR
jgi:hypothetical protein